MFKSRNIDNPKHVDLFSFSFQLLFLYENGYEANWNRGDRLNPWNGFGLPYPFSFFSSIALERENKLQYMHTHLLIAVYHCTSTSIISILLNVRTRFNNKKKELRKKNFKIKMRKRTYRVITKKSYKTLHDVGNSVHFSYFSGEFFIFLVHLLFVWIVWKK